MWWGGPTSGGAGVPASIPRRADGTGGGTGAAEAGASTALREISGRRRTGADGMSRNSIGSLRGAGAR
jgi:hypothetical protein